MQLVMLSVACAVRVNVSDDARVNYQVDCVVSHMAHGIISQCARFEILQYLCCHKNKNMMGGQTSCYKRLKNNRLLIGHSVSGIKSQKVMCGVFL